VRVRTRSEAAPRRAHLGDVPLPALRVAVPALGSVRRAGRRAGADDVAQPPWGLPRRMSVSGCVSQPLLRVVVPVTDEHVEAHASADEDAARPRAAKDNLPIRSKGAPPLSLPRQPREPEREHARRRLQETGKRSENPAVTAQREASSRSRGRIGACAGLHG
jgi:hypothetical protein